MGNRYPIETVAVMLALALPNAAWALWSPEPTGSSKAPRLSTAAPSPADTVRTTLGYTPPVSTQEMGQIERQEEDSPLIRRLAAGRAAEAIDIPLRDKDAAAAGGTFTRVDRKPQDGGKMANASDRTGDTPIPNPASPWLFLFALPALIMVRKRFRAPSSAR